jgi:hypothetical protein
MKRAMLIVTSLILALASADATTRSSGTKVQIVIRGTQEGPWKAYIFGATCHGKLELRQPASQEEPVEIVCK